MPVPPLPGPPGPPSPPGERGQPASAAGTSQPAPAPPRRSRLPLVLGGVGVLALAVVLVLVFVVFHVFPAGGTNTPTAAAQTFVDAVNTKDVNRLRGVTCSAQQGSVEAAQMLFNPASRPDVPPEYRNISITAKLGAVRQTDASHASATITVMFHNVPPPASQFLHDVTQDVALVTENGDWKLCG